MGAPLIPELALMLFPPGLGARSRRVTGMEWERRVEAAERPARPEPMIMALFSDIECVGDIVVFTIGMVNSEEFRRRQRTEARAMRREMEISVRRRLRDIGDLCQGGKGGVLIDSACLTCRLGMNLGGYISSNEKIR